MTQTARFGKVLARVREERGFPSAHAFYQARDGRRQFKMTYRNYLNAEQGKSLPKPDRMESIVRALGLEEHSAGARELVEAYLAALGVSGLAAFLGTPAPAEREDAALLEQAASQALKHKTVHLTREQWKLYSEDFGAYLCDDLLQMTKGGLTPAELSRMTGLSPAAIKGALASMSAAGAVKFSAGRARSVFEDKMVEAAPSLPAWVGIQAGLLRHQDRLAAEAALVQSSIHKLRMTETGLKRLRRHVDQLMLLAGLYETQEPGDGSAVYMVRAQVHRVFPRRAG